MTLTQLLLTLVCIFAAAKIGGEVAERLGQPPVLGELLGGILLGVSGLNLIDTHANVLHLLAELGVLLLLFEVGLETKLNDLTSVGPQAMTVALIGIVAPILLGIGACRLFGFSWQASVLIGTALSSTSIGVSARVLTDRGMLATATGSVILGAAIIDDVIGVSILAIISRLAESAAPLGIDTVVVVASSIGFVLATLWLGHRFVPYLHRAAAYMRSRGVLLTIFVTFAFAMAYIAALCGSAPLIGAFAAGLLLEETEQRRTLGTQVKPLADFFTPIFFVSVGASVDLGVLTPFRDRAAFLFTLLLIVVAVIGKLVAGFGVRKAGVSRLMVGVGMLARGEIGLIFAGVGVTSGMMSPAQAASLVAAVAVTTLMAPPWLARLAR